jgi:hypothetical protein
MAIEVRKLAEPLVAEVLGVDIGRPLPAAVRAERCSRSANCRASGPGTSGGCAAPSPTGRRELGRRQNASDPQSIS